MLLASCGKSVPKAHLSSDIDTLSYIMGITFSTDSAQMSEFLKSQGLDDSQKEKFLEGVWAGIEKGHKAHLNEAANPEDQAFNMGVNVGDQAQQRSLYRVEQMLEFGENEHLSSENFMAGFADYGRGTVCINHQGKPVDQAMAFSLADSLIHIIAERTFAVKYAAERKAADDFMAAIAKKDSVAALPGGIYYKELKAGTGEVPNPAATVRVHYEGRLTNGTIFDSSYQRQKEATFALPNVIKGWQNSISKMPVGSQWEIYIPWQQGYGALGQMPDIPPYATLIFKIELLGIEK